RAAHRRLSQSLELPARSLPGPRRRGDGEPRPYQASLLRQPPQYQSDRDRADRAADRLHIAARPRPLRLNAQINAQTKTPRPLGARRTSLGSLCYQALLLSYVLLYGNKLGGSSFPITPLGSHFSPCMFGITSP